MEGISIVSPLDPVIAENFIRELEQNVVPELSLKIPLANVM